MNFLEGLKRLYIIFSLLVMVGVAGNVWVDTRSSCIQAVFQDKTPASNYAAIPTEELLPDQRRRDSPIDPSDVKWDTPTTQANGCPTKAERVGYTALGAVVTGIFLFVTWLIFRWIMIGFFPALKREK